MKLNSISLAIACVGSVALAQAVSLRPGQGLTERTPQAAQSSIPSSCSGTPNTHPIYDGAPVLVNRTMYGSKWLVGPADVSPQLAMIHVYGSPYNMGYGYGSLMKHEISLMLPEALKYIASEVNSSIGFLPAPVRHWIETYGVEFALNLTYEATKPYIPQHYFELVQGMSDGSGQTYMDLFRLALFPELIKASCSIFGAWSDATASVNNGLVQLRALDWTTSGPFQQFPLVINYHPSNGYNFSAMTWAGLVGAITGFSSSGMAISEKVWIHYPGIENIEGYPFHFLLQDILQFDMDTDRALSRIATANRTCSIFIGIGDKYNNELKIVEYGWQEVNIYNDRNFPTYPDHDLFKDLVFVDKHTQPSHHPCLNDLMHQYYGSLSPETTISYITAGLQTGDMHVAIYDFQNNYMYVSNASPACEGCTVVPAYDRPFTRLNMAKLWETDLATTSYDNY